MLHNHRNESLVNRETISAWAKIDFMLSMTMLERGTSPIRKYYQRLNCSEMEQLLSLFLLDIIRNSVNFQVRLPSCKTAPFLQLFI